MIADAYSRACPERLMDAIGRSPGLGEADLAAVLSGNLHRIMRL